MSEDELQWAKKLVEENAFVMHLPTRVVGHAKKVYDGVIEQWVSPVNGKPLTCGVLLVEPGHGFIANPSAFIELSQEEAQYYLGSQTVVANALRELIRMGVEMNVRPATANVLLIASLRTQAMVLEQEHAKFFNQDIPDPDAPKTA